MKLQDNNALESKVLYLDWSKWRCGVDSENRLGKGHTKLLNDHGYMCCLGQFSLQLGCVEEEIVDWSTPEGVKEIPLLTNHSEESRNGADDSELTLKAMSINDKKETTPEQKIVALEKLFMKEGYKLEVINKPENDIDTGITTENK